MALELNRKINKPQKKFGEQRAAFPPVSPRKIENHKPLTGSLEIIGWTLALELKIGKSKSPRKIGWKMGSISSILHTQIGNHKALTSYLEAELSKSSNKLDGKRGSISPCLANHKALKSSLQIIGRFWPSSILEPKIGKLKSLKKTIGWKKGNISPCFASKNWESPWQVLWKSLAEFCPPWSLKKPKKNGWKTGSIFPCFAPQKWKSQSLDKLSGRSWVIKKPQTDWVENGQHFPLVLSHKIGIHRALTNYLEAAKYQKAPNKLGGKRAALPPFLYPKQVLCK